MGTGKLLVVVTLSLLACHERRRCGDGMHLKFQKPTVVMSRPRPAWYKTADNEVIATMSAGQTLPVCSLTPAKDYAVYEVRLPDGRTGYVEYDPAHVKEVVGASSPTKP